MQSAVPPVEKNTSADFDLLPHLRARRRQLASAIPHEERGPACTHPVPSQVPVPACELGFAERQELCGPCAASAACATAHAHSRYRKPLRSFTPRMHGVLTIFTCQSRPSPYQHPSRLTSSTLSDAGTRSDGEVDHAPSKPDPHGEGRELSCAASPTGAHTHVIRRGVPDAISSRTSRPENLDIKPRMKREEGVPIKTEAVKPEPGLYGPSKSFRAAFEQRQQALANGQSTTVSSEPDRASRVKLEEDVQTGPSEAFIAAFNSVYHAQPPDIQTPVAEREFAATSSPGLLTLTRRSSTSSQSQRRERENAVSTLGRVYCSVSWASSSSQCDR